MKKRAEKYLKEENIATSLLLVKDKHSENISTAIEVDEIMAGFTKTMLSEFCDHLNSYKGMEEARFDFMLIDFIEKLKLKEHEKRSRKMD